MHRGIPTLIAIVLCALGLTYWTWRMGSASPAPETGASNAASRPVPAEGWGPMRVMTANIRIDEPEDGDNGWVHRRDLLVKTLLKYEPEIIACQEVSPAQGAFLRKQLATWYDYYPRGGVGPADAPGGSTTSGDTRSARSQILGAFGETLASLNTIFFRNDRFEVIDGEAGLMIPEEPQANATENMFFSLAILRERRAAPAGTSPSASTNSGTLLVADVHFRLNDAFALRCALRLQQKIATWSTKYPNSGILVLGDMNRDRTSQVYAVLTQAQKPGSTIDSAPATASPALQDLFDYRQNPAGGGGAGPGNGGNYHAFTGRTNRAWPTDLIFRGGALKVVQPAEIIRDHGPDGRYPSDHFFTMGTVSW